MTRYWVGLDAKLESTLAYILPTRVWDKILYVYWQISSSDAATGALGQCKFGKV